MVNSKFLFTLLFIAILTAGLGSAYYYRTYDSGYYNNYYNYGYDDYYNREYHSTTTNNRHTTTVDYHKASDTIYLGYGATQKTTSYSKTVTEKPNYYYQPIYISKPTTYCRNCARWRYDYPATFYYYGKDYYGKDYYYQPRLRSDGYYEWRW